MFGSNNQKQPDNPVPPPSSPARASVGISEKQIEEIGIAPPLHVEHPSGQPAMPPTMTAPPLDNSAPPPDPHIRTIDPPHGDDLPGLSGVNLAQAYIDHGPAADKPKDAPTEQAPAPSPSAASLMSKQNDDDLLNIKQKALQNLTPLVDQLEQTPEEKFRTTMMLIQASDNADLIKDAYDAASAIKDEKARARALLDVVNEINYFTQHQENNQN